jgi:hypothetical protein
MAPSVWRGPGRRLAETPRLLVAAATAVAGTERRTTRVARRLRRLEEVVDDLLDAGGLRTALLSRLRDAVVVVAAVHALLVAAGGHGAPLSEGVVQFPAGDQMMRSPGRFDES